MKLGASALEDIRLADLLTFQAVARAESVSSAARILGVTPSQVSKAIARLEQRLGNTALLKRMARGVVCTEAGRALVPAVDAMVRALTPITQREVDRTRELVLAAPSYLLAPAMPVLAVRTLGVRWRGVELAPALLRAFAADGVFDMALLAGPKPAVPPSFVMSRLGVLRRSLYGNPALAEKLGGARRAIPVSKLLTVPFVMPSYFRDGSIVPVNDDCPLTVGERTHGHAVPTMAMALEIAFQCNQLVYGPELAARAHIAAGKLVEIHVEGWDELEGVNVTLLVHRDTVGAKEAKMAEEALSEMMLPPSER